jgi:hypothetical protein
MGLRLLHVKVLVMVVTAPTTNARSKEGHYMVCKIMQVTERASVERVLENGDARRAS